MTDKKNQFLVRETETDQRKKAKDDYIICLNPNLKRKLGLGKFAVIEHTITHQNKYKNFAAHCRVIIDRSLEDNEISTDQTVRNAIGIPFIYDRDLTFVEIYPLHLSFFQYLLSYLSYLFGRRYLFLRTCKADIPDLEKNLTRVPMDAFRLLGTEVGNKIVIESPVKKDKKDEYVLKTFAIKAYELLPDILERREKLEAHDLSARYPDAEEILMVSPDISRIFLDAHGREVLGIDSLDPVKARRDLADLFLKEFREFGIIFFLSLFTIVQVLPIQVTWIMLIPICFCSLIFALFLVLINIKARVK
ncbi:MAG: hypothetical protein ACE5IW_04085 [bacterium]